MKVKVNKLQENQIRLRNKNRKVVSKLVHNVLAKYKVAHEIGDIVYLITDALQVKRTVTSIEIYEVGTLFHVASEYGTSEHFDFEISTKPNLTLTCLN